MIKKFLIVFLLFSISIFSQIKVDSMKLLPFPKSITTTESNFKLDKNFTVHYLHKSLRINNAANRFLIRLAKRTGIFFETPIAKKKGDSLKPSLMIDIKRIGKLKLNEDESYNLTITSKRLILQAETDIGALRGMETLLQLLQADENGYFFPAVEINDSPRFPWRGLLIDVCRHFMPVEVIKRNLDGMAAVKMNVFHWHLSEDQGFRVESKVFPKLTELGSDGLYYTQEQIKEIIHYANERGIRVIPEFDIPGHATAMLAAYPELASKKGEYKIEREWGIFDPTLNPASDKTYEFLDKLFGEMTSLFPDEYFHIGGDENNGKQWDANENIQAFMKANNIKDNHALQAYFNNRVLKILTKYNKKMVGWDEILHEDMPNNIVIQSWRGKKALVEAAEKGYQVILSNGYYIDLMQPTSYHYLNDPLPKGIKLDEDKKKYVLGGEATMWAEMISPETIDSRIWPRTAAIAERLWSPQEINNVNDMYKRLDRISYLLEQVGLTHIKNYGMMLRRLTNNNGTEPLDILIQTIEPVKIYKRNALRKQNQQTPLTRVVDAATADAKTAREFENLVDSYLADKKLDMNKHKALVKQLEIWKNNHAKLLPVIKRSPILKEIEPMSKKLSELSALGLEILSYKEVHQSITEDLFNNGTEIINKAKVPVAQTELMITSSIEKLFGSLMH
jgi:hexosaminidase